MSRWSLLPVALCTLTGTYLLRGLAVLPLLVFVLRPRAPVRLAAGVAASLSHRAEVGAGVVPDCVRLRQVAADIGPLFGNDTVAYVHLHNAKQGCFFCRVDRT